MKPTDPNQKRRVTWVFILIVFLILIVTVGIEVGLAAILYSLNIIQFDDVPSAGFSLLVIFLSSSIIIGTIVSFLASKLITRPINLLIDSMKKLANGKYDTRIYLGKTKIIKNIADNFNLLAEELQNTEMLRSDFTNNFSHEFKTPIVSIYGFATLVNKGNISEEKKTEYLQIIEEEAKRLSTMATNVLHLAKIENQSIITGKKQFNLAEQIRTCVLMLEKKWTEKNINLQLDFDEYKIQADADLLKHVWLNLIDNAIKFSEQNSSIEISMKRVQPNVVIKISNYGEVIKEDDIKRIFNKFYQADRSHKTEGNGIGLSIVKRIIDMHHGSVNVESKDNKTSFIITLPEK